MRFLKGKINIYYYRGNNFGDELAPFLIRKLTGKEIQYKELSISRFHQVLRILKRFFLGDWRDACVRIKEIPCKGVVLCSVGSILNRRNYHTYFWGSGFLNSNEYFYGGHVFAVRGKYSERRLKELGYNGCSTFGDPALLLPLFLGKSIGGKGVGIVPHYLDYEYFSHVYFGKYGIVNLSTRDVVGTVKEITSYKYILSSSLHGLIIAHAYHVPALWIQKNETGSNGFKFRDYFSAVGIAEYEGFKNIDEILASEETIQDLFLRYERQAKLNVDLHAVQKLLLESFPFPLVADTFLYK